MLKLLPLLALATSLGACSPDRPTPIAPTLPVASASSVAAVVPIANTEANGKPQTVAQEIQPKPESTEQVKTIAREFGVSEGKVHDTANRAAEMSGGNASKQDMLDALKAATGK